MGSLYSRIQLPAAFLFWGLQFSFLSPSLGILLAGLFDADATQIGVVLIVYNVAGLVAFLVIPTLADAGLLSCLGKSLESFSQGYFGPASDSWSPVDAIIPSYCQEARNSDTTRSPGQRGSMSDYFAGGGRTNFERMNDGDLYLADEAEISSPPCIRSSPSHAATSWRVASRSPSVTTCGWGVV